MACIAVYQDNGANPAIETIPPCVSQALATNNGGLIIFMRKGECDIHLQSCFQSS